MILERIMSSGQRARFSGRSATLIGPTGKSTLSHQSVVPIQDLEKHASGRLRYAVQLHVPQQRVPGDIERRLSGGFKVPGRPPPVLAVVP